MRRQRQLAQQREEDRWSRFRGVAVAWQEQAQLLAFVDELKRRFRTEGDAPVGARQLSDWISWAQARVEASDPFNNGLHGLFDKIAANDAASRVTFDQRF